MLLLQTCYSGLLLFKLLLRLRHLILGYCNLLQMPVYYLHAVFACTLVLILWGWHESKTTLTKTVVSANLVDKMRHIQISCHIHLA